MGIQIGSNFKPISGHTLFLDSTIAESYGGSGSTWTNLSNTSSNCTLYSSPTYSRLSSTGAGVLSFNGTSQYGLMSSINLQSSFTMIFWAMKNSTSGNGRLFGAGVNSNYNFTEGGMGVTFGVDGSTLMADTFRSNVSEYASGGTIEAGKWHHMAAVLNSSTWTISLYLDGNLVDTNGFYTFRCSLVNTYLGQQSNGGGNYWNGSISQAMIYTGTTFTQAQLLDHYNQTKSRYGR